MRKLTLLIVAMLGLGIGTSKAQYTDLWNFYDTGTNGGYPWGSLTLSGKVLYGMTEFGGTSDDGLVFSIDTDGANYKDLLDFNYTNGALPYGDLTLFGSELFGMTEGGGVNDSGCIFSIDTNGSGYKDLHDFGGMYGGRPYGSLALYANKLYGMTAVGGTSNHGCVFSVDTDGSSYKVIFNFNQTNGAQPYGSLTPYGSKLYGMTQWGGANDDGVIFSLDTNGNGFNDLWDFYDTGTYGNANGKLPYGSLTLPQAGGNKLYGMAWEGGVNEDGLIFSFDTNGKGFKDLLDFNVTNGKYPIGSLTLSGGILFGTTEEGGGDGNIFLIDTNGGGYKNLFYFNSANGLYPRGSLAISGSVLYGMTYEGGINNYGVIFSLDTNNSATSIIKLPANPGAINVYPNPNNGTFTLLCHSSPPRLRRGEESLPILQVYNVLGQNVLTETLHSAQGDNTVDISSQPNGVYLYRVLTIDRTLIGEGKVVIQK